MPGFGMAAILCFLVNFLLIVGTNRLCGFPLRLLRGTLGALAGALYAGICLVPGMAFLGEAPWPPIVLLLVGILSFGCSRSGLRRSFVLALLVMAMGGMAMTMGRGGLWGMVAAAACICLGCMAGFRGQLGRQLVQVELCHGEKHLHLTALQDTGNTLRDPVTGRPVLVVDAQVAGQLTGLSGEQLKKPVESMGLIPGLRLIPYRCVSGQGLLLGLRIQKVRIGNWKGSGLVAFAPEGLDAEGTYQALTGGAV